MKKSRLLPLLVCAATFGALNLSAVSLQAAPPAPTKTKMTKRPRGTLTRRVQKAIETKMGKPLTPDQKKRLTAANKLRLDTNKAASEKFMATAAGITGLSVEALKEIARPVKKPLTAPKGKAAPVKR